MTMGFRSRAVGRRSLLRWATVAAGSAVLMPILQACQQPAPTPQVVVKEVPVEKIVTKEVPVEKIVTKEVSVEKVVTKEVTVQVTATPLSRAAIKGNLQIIQQRGFNPLQTTFIHNLLLKTSADRNWPLDKSYVEGFTAGTNIYEKLQAQVAAGDSPDVFIGNEDTFRFWDLKLVQPVDDIVNWAESQFGKAPFLQRLNNHIEGKWYAVPTWNATGGYWALKSWYQGTGFDLSVRHTYDEWREIALKISDPAKKRWGWGNTVNRSGDGNTNVMSVIYTAGGRVATEDNKVAFNSPETIAGYEWLKDTYTNPKWANMLPPGVNSWTDPTNNENYLAGILGFSSNGGTMVATASAQKPDIYKDTVLVPHPSGSVGKKQTLQVAGPYTFHNHLFAQGKNPDAGREMLQMLLSKENQQAILENSPALAMPGYEKFGWDLPVIKNVPNGIMEISRSELFDEKRFFRFHPQKTDKLWVRATSSENIETDVMAEVMKGTPIATAVANGHKRMEAVLEKFKGR
ncbi:MAG: extracellular solute-binding protein [Chloroflexi bacterium]|nr:extracellular solute-binding protein [Chloroflexota bacterium]